MNRTRAQVLVGMVLAAALARLLPHPWNFTPIGAIALFSGAQFSRSRTAFMVSTLSLLIGDVYLGLHSLMPFVYGSFALTVCLGFWVRRQPGFGRVIIASVASSTLFYLVTNFGDWAMLDTYPKNPAGLLDCYLAGLPYYRSGMLGDLLYSGLLFGGLALAKNYRVRLREPMPELAAS